MPTPQKDIQAVLLRERNRRRRPGDVPYPLTDPPPDMLNYEHWDHLFLKSCFRNLTLHHFETPPSMVLDVGCGTGIWALDAVRQWPSSTIIGFDMKDSQPRLDDCEIYRDLADRLSWKQGNFLDGLPFPSSHFDFVRVARLGLAVPEDEWQFVLEEISRVMKSGAILEIIEEDLIFPYCQSARSRPERPRPSPLTVIDLPISVSESNSSDTISSRNSLNTLSSSTLWSAFDEPADGTLSRKLSLTPLLESPALSFNGSRFSPKSPFSIKSHSTFPSRGSTPTIPSPVTSLPISEEPPSYNVITPHPQDHSKLKAAWDAMLSHRFLAPRVVTVLLFYLSSCFVDVKSHPSLHIPLPPNSGVGPPTQSQRTSRGRSDTFNPIQQFELQKTTDGRRSDEESPPESPTSASHRQSTWAPMHLAKVVKTVQACKEAIFDEYEKLHSADLPPVQLTSPKDGRKLIVSSTKSSTREIFEREWLNWENDMTDRMGMRDQIMSQLQWPEPPGERPDWRVWRSNIKLLEDTQHTGDLCRTLRCFVARKS
ncbi:hypothetical protein D9758_003609 [Tetrapyrgos nigripes]|uniref:Methyltransferase domain-containing protein n=1 Tax=Tetrapyrgos nigripes TaxID=182062 RepID=A0A8H5GMK4_9AGAR|nr:hypothetical protein D9758_003609 [Tetrapyrgos nigripes]